MNGLDLKKDLLRKLYIEDATALSGVILDGLQADVVSAINRAFQNVWTAPHDYFRRSLFQFNTVAGTSTYTLDQSLQEILGPVKIDGGTPYVRPVGDDRGNLDNYATRFKGALTNTLANARPEVYFLERLWQNAADSTTVNMIFAPAPDVVYAVDFYASTEAPSFTLAQLDASVVLPVPHEYVESVLLPIARFFVIESHFYLADRRPAETKKLAQGYVDARKQIGDLDPQLPELRGLNPAAA